MYEGTGVGDPIIYWILRSLLLLICIYCGYGMSYDKPSHFNRYARFVGISYSLITGLRWMRGMDYAHYYNDLVTLFGQDGTLYGRGQHTTDPELIYDAFVFVFHYSGLPFWFAFVLYGAVLIYGLITVLKHYPKAAVWALPIFYILTINSSENLIRQYIAVAFIFYAYHYYLINKRAKMWIMLIIVPLIHFSGLIVDAVFLMLVYTPGNIIKRLTGNLTLIILTIIFLYAYFLWETSSLTGFADYLSSHFNLGDERGAHYVRNASRWFTEEGSLSYRHTGKMTFTINIVKNCFRFITMYSCVFYGFYALKANSKLLIPYIFSYLYIILRLIGADIEMFQRFYYWFCILYPLMFGISVEYMHNKTIKIIVIVSTAIFYIGYSFIALFFATQMNGYGFIWDAPARISLF